MRALRHRMREYLARVEAGERFEVTLFGRTVAQLEPPPTRPAGMARLIAEGRVTPAIDHDLASLPTLMPSATGISATAALLAERETDDR